MEKFLLVGPNCSDLAQSNIEIKKFHDCENYIYIPDIEKLKGKHVAILHRCYPDQDSRLLQLLQILSAVKPVASKVTAIIPYLPYSRQDEISRPGETDSATMVCKLLSGAGLDGLITFDCHFLQSGETKKNVAGLNIENRSIVTDLFDYVKPRVSNPVFISHQIEVPPTWLKKKAGSVWKKPLVNTSMDQLPLGKSLLKNWMWILLDVT